MGGAPYTRLPAHAKAIVDPTVWGLSRQSAGIKTRFATAATDVWVRWKLASGLPKGDWLWPPTGHGGVDIYIDDEVTGSTWATSSGNNPKMAIQNVTSAGLVTGLFNVPAPSDGKPRNYTVYLPLGAETTSIEVAAMDAHSLDNVPLVAIPPPANASLPRSHLPVLWYGTCSSFQCLQSAADPHACRTPSLHSSLGVRDTNILAWLQERPSCMAQRPIARGWGIHHKQRGC
jgi:hypothetical protein